MQGWCVVTAPHIWSQAVTLEPWKGGLVRLATKPHRDVGAGQECKISLWCYFFDEYSVRSPNSSLRCQDMWMSPWHCTGLYFRHMLMAFNFRLTPPCLFDTKYRDRRFCVVDPTRLSYYIPANPMRSVGNIDYIVHFTYFYIILRDIRKLQRFRESIFS